MNLIDEFETIGNRLIGAYVHQSDEKRATEELNRDLNRLRETLNPWEKSVMVEPITGNDNAADNINDEWVTDPLTFEELNVLVKKWASDRQITQHSNPLGQSRKTMEECRELTEEAAKLDILYHAIDQLDILTPDDETTFDYLTQRTLALYQDAIGDVLVTLIVGASTVGLDVVDCLASAYEEIKDRKGYLREDGVFVKEETSKVEDTPECKVCGNANVSVDGSTIRCNNCGDAQCHN